MGNTNVGCPIPWDVSHGIPVGMTFLWTSLGKQPYTARPYVLIGEQPYIAMTLCFDWGTALYCNDLMS